MKKVVLEHYAAAEEAFRRSSRHCGEAVALMAHLGDQLVLLIAATVIALVLALALAATGTPLSGLASTFGEEVGWRGILQAHGIANADNGLEVMPEGAQMAFLGFRQRHGDRFANGAATITGCAGRCMARVRPPQMA